MNKYQKLIKQYIYKVVQDQEDGIWIAESLEMPGLSCHGKTAKKAVMALKEALELTLYWMDTEGEVLPEPKIIGELDGICNKVH
jgi:predicted RNase H-like HicB family nuclease